MINEGIVCPLLSLNAVAVYPAIDPDNEVILSSTVTMCVCFFFSYVPYLGNSPWSVWVSW